MTKFAKRFAAMVAAVLMVCSISFGAAAYEYVGFASKTKEWLTDKGNASYRHITYVEVKNEGPLPTGTVLGQLKGSYTPLVGVKCTSYCKYDDARSHYARIVSGGKVKVGSSASSNWFSETGCVTLKNGSARFEGWYTV